VPGVDYYLGYYLLGAIALGIVFIGARFLFAPYAAAAGFSVAVRPDAIWHAYLSVKAIHDIASGLFTAILMFNRSAHLLGWFMLAATSFHSPTLQSSSGTAERRRPHSASMVRPLL
jgi:hypothetical protein